MGNLTYDVAMTKDALAKTLAKITPWFLDKFNQLREKYNNMDMLDKTLLSSQRARM